MRLYCGFLRIAFPLDRNTAADSPFCRVCIGADAARVVVEYVVVDVPETVVVREFLFDLGEKGLCDRLDHGEDYNLDLRIAEDVLNIAGECDYGRFKMSAGPKIKMTVWIGFPLAAAADRKSVVSG